MATVLYAKLPLCCFDAEANLECSLQSASLVSDYGDPGFPTRQDPPLGLADEIQRSASTTFGTRLVARVAGRASG